MDTLERTMRRLHPRGPAARGLVVDAEGVALGPDCVLVRRYAAGYVRLGDAELDWIGDTVFGKDAALPLSRVLQGVTDALNGGDLAKAQALALALPLGEFDERQLRKLHRAADLLKAGFDPDQARDEGGRWTNGGGGATTSGGGGPDAPPPKARSTGVGAGSVAVPAAPGFPSEFSDFVSKVAPELVPLLRSMLPKLVSPVLAFGFALIPTNRANVNEGLLPGSKELGYRYDEGLLTVYHRDAKGRETEIFNGRAGADHLYRDADGTAVARQLDDGMGVVVSPDALPVVWAKAKPKLSDVVNHAAVETSLKDYAEAARRSEPRYCPDPSPDPGKNESIEAGMYQWNVCHMPANSGILFGGVRFDGCEIPTGVLLECKGPNLEQHMDGPDAFKRYFKGRADMLAQMDKQHLAAGERRVIWYVAEKGIADYLRAYAKANHYDNIDVRWTPAPPHDPAKFRPKETPR